ncbi:MAG: VOC family protein [Bacillota bacterium]|nr:MAG: VOC family protein [Bacillota bacterium]
MNLGAFSLSLNVKDIKESYAFYQKLGFTQIGGHIDQLWLILKNGESIIGLFQGMIEQNTLTFNPGWSQEGKHVDPYDDVRVIHDLLVKEKIEVEAHIKTDQGPAYLILKDPDGNPILIDQHR